MIHSNCKYFDPRRSSCFPGCTAGRPTEIRVSGRRSDGRVRNFQRARLSGRRFRGWRLDRVSRTGARNRIGLSRTARPDLRHRPASGRDLPPRRGKPLTSTEGGAFSCRASSRARATGELVVHHTTFAETDANPPAARRGRLRREPSAHGLLPLAMARPGPKRLDDFVVGGATYAAAAIRSPNSGADRQGFWSDACHERMELEGCRQGSVNAQTETLARRHRSAPKASRHAWQRSRMVWDGAKF